MTPEEDALIQIASKPRSGHAAVRAKRTELTQGMPPSGDGHWGKLLAIQPSNG